MSSDQNVERPIEPPAKVAKVSHKVCKSIIPYRIIMLCIVGIVCIFGHYDCAVLYRFKWKIYQGNHDLE